MCGVAGVAQGRRGDGVGAGSLAWRMASALAHRGPDGSGLYVDPYGRVALAHRRLAVVDVSPRGAEPLRSRDGRFQLVFNGEIYNAAELRRELTARGHVLRSRSDAEVLVALYAESNTACLARLRGMFAFAVWDERRGELFLARDRLGEKPLYYAVEGGRLLFASELRGLAASGALSCEVDPAAVAVYLALGSIPAPTTIWRGVRALPPGGCLSWRAGNLRLWRYWTPHPGAPIEPSGEGSLRARLAEVVRLRLVGERPCGVLLSGGIDSAAILALAVSEGACPAAHTLVTDGWEGELVAAAAVTGALGVPHHVHRVSGAEVAADLDAILSTLDQPTVDGINFSLLTRCARRAGTVVALTGIGGDEMFGGYPSGRRLEWLRRLGGGGSLLALLRGVTGPLARRHLFGRLAKLAYFLADPASPLAAYLAVRGLLGPGAIEVLTAGGSDAHLAATLQPALWPGSASEDPAAIELALYTAGQLLRDADAVGMAHGLEVRSPFLDHQLVELALGGGVVRRGTAKAALRAAVSGLVPPEARRRRKRPFTLPWEVWLRGPLRERVEEMIGEGSADDPICPAAARRLWKSFMAGSAHWSRPWAVAVLRHWLAVQRRLRIEREGLPPPHWRAA